MVLKQIDRHRRIIGALIMREMLTRYGREGIGFMWLVAEPLMFCFGVLIMWSVIKPPYEHGVRLAPFLMTGYMSLLLLRHIVSHCLSAVQANAGLLYHRQISVLHIYLSRWLMEVAGATIAFFVVYAVLFGLGQVGLPHDVLLLYSGWFLMSLVALGIALIFAALALQYEIVERIVQVVMYLMIPASGAFVMASWIPDKYRDAYLHIPMPNAVEMVRAGVFGEFVSTYYHADYLLACAAVLIVIGLLMVSRAKKHLEIE
ncbi:ABC transporter permease [Brevundimonas vesicularis]|uniref:ABC transporter n=1 Tax=Brevundimonas vesicularis TaxID=41276 RepID=A0A1Z3U827_BREVE|nr:ABC transporter permease [Brevundimonas vesicularis]ASE39418.1 ABC transporter [Brevundimonas vesicularis]MDX2335356.1 ABC transporter permease [Brevundimonas vesicularis]